MKRSSIAFFLIVISAALSWIFCEKGLAPPPGEGTGYNFPRPPLGGNPMGDWIPDGEDAVEVHFLAQVPADSVLFETEFKGLFSFQQTFICSVNAVLGFRPIIFNNGEPLPLDIVVTDTLFAHDFFKIVDDKILLTPIDSEIFDLQVLGFNGETDRLDLLTQALEYVYEGFYTLEYYLILHMVRVPNP